MSASVGIVKDFAKRAARNGIRVGPAATATTTTAAPRINATAAPFVPGGKISDPDDTVLTPDEINGTEDQEKKEEVEGEKMPEKEDKKQKEEQEPGFHRSESDVDSNGAADNNTESSSESDVEGEVTFKLK
ncbi:hypothetical protein PG993_012629 [Apiospora rasikravindrae]|uniref:Uncharacterized protein n=1 Tax=Apiospora rasikravindrae TaxID=990691 RepID=A0ABR1S3D9_9PEZI